MNDQTQSLKLFISHEHECSYLPDKVSKTLFIDPNADKTASLYAFLQDRGFRRSGDEIYQPKCDQCQMCHSSRIPVQRFEPKRSQRRLLKKYKDKLIVRKKPAELTEEYFQLYRTYINERHVGGEMENPTPEDFTRFLTSSWSDCFFLELRYEDQLIAVAVTDQTPNSLSALYTFFDPKYAYMSPGVLGILSQIELANAYKLPWLYLGYWIPECRKMLYKTDYRPLQLLSQGKWHEFNPKQVIEFT